MHHIASGPITKFANTTLGFSLIPVKTFLRSSIKPTVYLFQGRMEWPLRVNERGGPALTHSMKGKTKGDLLSFMQRSLRMNVQNVTTLCGGCHPHIGLLANSCSSHIFVLSPSPCSSPFCFVTKKQHILIIQI